MKTFTQILIRCLAFLWSMVASFFFAIIDACTKQSGAIAEFGKVRLIASRFNRGFVVSSHCKIPTKAAYSNMLITGVTGVGKSSRLIIPTLFTLRNCSLLIHDPSQELYNTCAPFLSKHFVIKTLNFSVASKSAGYNPLSRIKSPNDVNKFAHLLVSASLDKGAGDPFWSLASKNLLSIITRLVLHQPQEYRNLSNIIQVLNIFAADCKKVDAWIAKTGDEKLITDYKALISTPEKTLQSIVSSLRAALECFDTTEIAKVTATDTIDFDSLRTTPQVIFLHNSIADLSFLSTLTSVFFEQFYNHVLQQLPGKHDLDIFCILDEMSSLRVPLLPLALANCRKFRNGNLLSIQGKSQLKGFYKEDTDSLLSNCLTKLYLPGLTAIDELRELEALSGKCTYKDKRGNEKTKSLITVDEIRQLKRNQALILSQNHPLIKTRTRPYFQSLIYRQYAKLLPVPMTSDIPDTPLALMK